MRGFGVGRALRHKHLAEIVDVRILLRIDGEIARVVDRCAVDGEAHLVAVGAAHAQTAAKQSGAVVAEGVHTGQHFDRLIRVAGRAECLQMRAVNRAARLRCVFLNDQPGTRAAGLAFDRNPANVSGGCLLCP